MSSGECRVKQPVNPAHAQDYEETTVTEASKALKVGERGIRYANVVIDEGTEEEIADCDSGKTSPQTTAKKIRVRNNTAKTGTAVLPPKPKAWTGPRIRVPDGKTVENLCREAMDLENNGMPAEKAAGSRPPVKACTAGAGGFFAERGRMSEIDIITPDLIKDAAYVSDAWRTASQSRLDGIFETGRRLIEIQDKYRGDRGKWSQLIGDNQWKGQSLLPFQKTHTQRLIRIAGCDRLPPHAGVLPDDSTTLSKLVSLTDERFQELLDDGTINPNMGRNDMSEPRIQ